MSRPPRPVDPGPRTGVDRLMDWGREQIYGERQPMWYEEPGVYESMGPEDQAIIRQEMQRANLPPVGEMAGVSNLRNASEAVGQAGRMVGGMFEGPERPPQENGWSRSPYVQAMNAAVEQEQAVRTRRLAAEQSLIEFILQDMAPSPVPQIPAGPDVPIPQGFSGGLYNEEYAQRGEMLTDPEVQRELEQKRFQQMQQLRRLPPPTQR